MKNDNLRADRDDLDDFIPRAPAKRDKSLVLQVAAGVFLGGLALWLVQLAATALYAKLLMGPLHSAADSRSAKKESAKLD